MKSMPNSGPWVRGMKAGSLPMMYPGVVCPASRTPRLTASWISKGGTTAPAGDTSILSRPPEVFSIVDTSSLAASSGNTPSGQAVCIFQRMGAWAPAGGGAAPPPKSPSVTSATRTPAVMPARKNPRGLFIGAPPCAGAGRCPNRRDGKEWRDSRRVYTLCQGVYRQDVCRLLALPLHGAGQAGDVVLDEERIDDRDRDGAEQRPRHELAPEVDVAADQLRDDAHRDRLLLRRGEEHERVDELVPGQGEREDARGQDSGHRDREDDAHHGPEAGGPVDPRALLELLGNGLEVAHEEPGTERNQERGVGEDQGPRGIAELEGADDVGEGNEEQGRRHQVGDEDAGAQQTRHRELEPAERVAGQEPAEERDGSGHAGDEEGV